MTAEEYTDTAEIKHYRDILDSKRVTAQTELPQEYVKISTSSEGDAMVEVLATTPDQALEVYTYTVTALRKNPLYPVANDKANEIKATNENTKFQPTVTIKGKGTQVVDTYISELKRMEK